MPQKKTQLWKRLKRLSRPNKPIAKWTSSIDVIKAEIASKEPQRPPLTRIPKRRSAKWKRVKNLAAQLDVRPQVSHLSPSQALDQEIQRLNEISQQRKSHQLKIVRADGRLIGIEPDVNLASTPAQITQEWSNIQRQTQNLAQTFKYVFNGTPFVSHEGPSELKDYQDPHLVKKMIRLLSRRNPAFKRNVRVILTIDGEPIKDITYSITVGKRFTRRARFDWTESGESGDNDMIYNQPDHRVVLIVQPETKINAKKLAQRFRQGKTHCVIEPIKRWTKSKIPTIGRDIWGYRNKYKRLEQYEQQYDQGLTIDEIQHLCNDIGIDVHISDLFKNNTQIIRSKKQARNTFRFYNTQLDHVDLCMPRSDAIKLSQLEMHQKRDELIANRTAYIYGGCPSKITWISTNEHYYQLHQWIDLHVNTFMALIPKSHIHHHEPHSKLVRNALHQCGYHVFHDVADDYDGEVVRLDHRYSYASHQQCEYYQGFATRFTEYRQVNTDNNRKFLQDHVGIYRVIITKTVDRLSLVYQPGEAVFPSPELLFMLEAGVEFEIDYGCWTQCPTYLEFDKLTYMRDVDGVRFYQKMIGLWSILPETYTVHIDGTREWAQHLKCDYPVTYHEEEDTGRISIEFPKEPKNIKHVNHLAAFFTSYSRIQVLQQLLEINPNDVIAILTDEIVVKKGAQYHVRPGFREKNSDKPLPFYYESEFLSSYDEVPVVPTATINYIDGQYQRQSGSFTKSDNLTHVHIGPGGSGKTYSILADPGYLRLLYTCPSHKLRNAKQQEFPHIRTDVTHNLWNKPFDARYIRGFPRDGIIPPATIVIDESTQLSQEVFETIRSLYPASLIILCGDHDQTGKPYQLPCVSGKPLDFPQMCLAHHRLTIVEHQGNRRAKCPKLKELLSWIRNHMFGDEGVIDDHIKSVLRCSEGKDSIVRPSQVKNEYQINDYVLTGRRTSERKGVKFWTRVLDRAQQRDGTKQKKYLVTKKTKGYFNGDVIITDQKPLKSWELRHAFTCHQIQGETIKSKIFIDIDNLFNYAQMVYVALSRAEYLSQIRIITNDASLQR